VIVELLLLTCLFYFSSRRRHTRSKRDWSSDVCSSDLLIYIIISFILYPFARALIDLMFGFKLRHLLDKQKGVTYYFNQLLFLLDFILYHLSLFVAPIAIIVL